MTVTRKVAAANRLAVLFAGCLMNLGGVRTVSAATTLVTEPSAFVTTTEYPPALRDCTLVEIKSALGKISAIG